MLKILVCFKVVKDVDYVLKNDWNDIANNCMDWSYVRSIFNCYDEGALENALLLKDSYPNNIELDAITINEFDLDMFNKHLLAAGYDKVINLKTDCSHFTPYKNAQTIANFIKNDNYDIIITGEENAIGNNGVFYYALGGLLNYDVLNNVSKIAYEDNKIIVETQNTTETLTYEGKTNAVYAFKNTENAYLRFPTLMDRLKAKNKTELIVDAKEYEPNCNLDIPIVKAYYKEEKKQVEFLEGTNEEIIDTLLEKEVKYE